MENSFHMWSRKWLINFGCQKGLEVYFGFINVHERKYVECDLHQYV